MYYLVATIFRKGKISPRLVTRILCEHFAELFSSNGKGRCIQYVIISAQKRRLSFANKSNRQD